MEMFNMFRILDYILTRWFKSWCKHQVQEFLSLNTLRLKAKLSPTKGEWSKESEDNFILV